MRVVVVGAGVSGLVAARVLAEAGLDVRVVSPTLGEASRVPVALLNPVRGKRGSVAPEAAEALAALWNFYPRFAPLHAGILRPVPRADWPEWKRKLAESPVPHRWTDEGLLLETGGWLETAPLLERLAEGLEVIPAGVVRAEGSRLLISRGAPARPGTPEDSEVLDADRVVFAAGAGGAHLLGLGGRFTAGSVLGLEQHFPQARSYGVYVAGQTLGGSYLPHTETYRPHRTLPHEAEWLLGQAERLLGFRPLATSSWAGVRYRLDRNYLRPVPGGFALTGFGSAGFFYAPLFARRLLEALAV
ncbi:MAG: FAD-dependent oxidoreductase [Meiothermus sp.]|nr:FAD-dependent oxidoreductase [Meiothermus sp.]